MNNLNVKTGDNVMVIAGKDAGKQGKVLAVYPKTSRVVVAGCNIISKHQKARKAQDKSEIVKKEAPIDVSNVMLVCPTCGKVTRVKHKVEDGKSVRVCKCGAVLDKKFVKETKKTAKKADAAKAKASKSETAAAAEESEKQTSKKTVKKVAATAANKEQKVAGARKSSQRGV